jgi:hypothetical protein
MRWPGARHGHQLRGLKQNLCHAKQRTTAHTTGQLHISKERTLRMHFEILSTAGSQKLLGALPLNWHSKMVKKMMGGRKASIWNAGESGQGPPCRAMFPPLSAQGPPNTLRGALRVALPQ